MTFNTGEIMYDRDGTLGLILADGTLAINSELTATQKQNLRNPDVSAAISLSADLICLYFPEPVDLTAFWFTSGGLNTGKCHFSKDSTAPTNGDWQDWSTGTGGQGSETGTSIVVFTPSQIAAGSDPSQFHATAIDVVAMRIRGRVVASGNVVTDLRLWGGPSDPTSYLALWDETLDQPAASGLFDFGGIQQGTSADIAYRIKNLHPTLTATDVTLSIPNDFGTNDIITGTTFDLAGGGFSAPLNIGNLAAEAISGVITQRRTVGGAEALSTGLASLLLDASWS